MNAHHLPLCASLLAAVPCAEAVAQQLPRLLDVVPGSSASAPGPLSSHYGRVFFSARFGGNRQLHISDGTASGTHPVSGAQGLELFNARDFADLGDRVVFAADTQMGSEPCVVDLDGRNGQILVDLDPGFGGSTPAHFTRFHDEVWFTARSGADRWLYRTGGQVGDVQPVRRLGSQIFPGGSFRDYGPWRVGQHLVCLERDSATATWSLVIDGSASSAAIGTYHGERPDAFAEFEGGIAYVARVSATGGRQVRWFHETEAPTGRALATVGLGNFDPAPAELTAVRDRLYFTAEDGRRGRELWSIRVGSRPLLVADLRPGFVGSEPRSLTRLGSDLLFSADTPAVGRELYKVSGFTHQVELVRDLSLGTGSSLIDSLTATGTRYAYFASHAPAAGIELWRTDGTRNGTMPIADIEPGLVGSIPGEFTTCGGQLFFRATTDAAGQELYVTDAPASIEQVGGPWPDSHYTTPGWDLELDSDSAVVGDGWQLRGRAHGGGRIFMLLGAPTAPMPLPGLSGPLYLDPATLLNSGIAMTPVDGEWGVEFPIPARPSLAGLVIGAQAFHFDGTFRYVTGSNGLIVVVGAN